ncbi:MAG: ISNCY family transposase [Candidatus Magasanikbacteria bacterium]|nr:ISNCY family transposase [Candidatus Magasanikbacteria bacterium]
MDYITMSHQEIKRYDIIKRLINKELNGSEAAGLLGLSVRHTKRLKAKVKEKGAAGLAHASRGKPGNRKMPETERHKIIKLIRRHYFDFKPGFAAEKLSEKHRIVRDPKTIRQIMIGEGLWKPKQKKKSVHRSWRQRKAHFGEMIQFDGSYEHWLEDRNSAGEICLLAGIDDATGIVTKAKFDTDEGVFPVFGFWKEYVTANGKPDSIYVDKFSTYKMNQRVAIENHDTKTQFERAMSELNIEPITAHSSEAKGRVERLFHTLQDRLIKELRLAGISSVAEANEFLEKTFLPKFNARFSVEPRAKTNLHKQLNQTEIKKLGSVFSRQYHRTVRSDWTVSFNNQWYQLTKQQPATVCKNDIITVEQRLDGSIRFRLRGKYLNYEPLPERPKKLNNNLAWVIAAGQTSTPKPSCKPAPDHPWRRPFIHANKLTQTIQV